MPVGSVFASAGIDVADRSIKSLRSDLDQRRVRALSFDSVAASSAILAARRTLAAPFEWQDRSGTARWHRHTASRFSRLTPRLRGLALAVRLGVAAHVVAVGPPAERQAREIHQGADRQHRPWIGDQQRNEHHDADEYQEHVIRRHALADLLAGIDRQTR